STPEIITSVIHFPIEVSCMPAVTLVLRGPGGARPVAIGHGSEYIPGACAPCRRNPPAVQSDRTARCCLRCEVVPPRSEDVRRRGLGFRRFPQRTDAQTGAG